MVKRRQSEFAFYLGTSTNRHLISVNISFILKYFLQNLKNLLVAKRTIYGITSGRPVDSWVAFGNRISAALLPGIPLIGVLTHWGRVTHICVSKLTIIGSDNGLSPGRRQAIIWTNAGILLTRTLGTKTSVKSYAKFIHFHSQKCIWKCRLRNGVYLVSASTS